MRASVKVSTLVIALVAASAAPAAGQATAGMELAGGSLTGQGSFAGGSDVGMKVSPAGDAVTIRAAAAVRCGGGRSSEGEGVGTGAVAPDGSFTVQLTKRAQFGERGFRSSVVAAGRITGDRATGTLRVATSLRGRRRCSGTQTFAARVVPDLSSAAAAAAPRGATLLGRSTGLAPSGAPFALNLRVAGDGRSITRSVAGFFDNWNRRNPDLEETNYSGRIPIRSNGTFTKTERFTLRYADGDERSVVRTVGRFVAGGATGTMRVTKTFRSRRSGKVLARADSGLMRWSAAP
jgi:hypothetical protein